MIIKFEELRRVKDSLPHGSMQKIASELNIDEQVVKNFFGAEHFENGGFVSFYREGGINGGYVKLANEEIFQKAQNLINLETTT